jgi:hypothetical protein
MQFLRSYRKLGFSIREGLYHHFLRIPGHLSQEMILIHPQTICMLKVILLASSTDRANLASQRLIMNAHSAGSQHHGTGSRDK